MTAFGVWAIPTAVVLIIGYGLMRGVRVFEVFLEGAKEGLEMSWRILPALVALVVADAGDAGRDAVLHLDAGVHFHEEGLALAGDDPFPGAHVVIAHLAGHGQGVVDDVLQHLGGIEAVVHLGGHEAGGHFHALLQAGGLDGAVAGAEVHGVLAAAVGHDLDFQVVEVRDALFDEHALVLELAQGVVADAAVHGAEVVDEILENGQ